MKKKCESTLSTENATTYLFMFMLRILVLMLLSPLFILGLIKMLKLACQSVNIHVYNQW